MGVPLLLTWLRSNFGVCVTYVAPRNTGWGRKTIQHQQSNGSEHTGTEVISNGDEDESSESAMPGPIPLTAKPRVSIQNTHRTNKPKSFDNVYIDLNSLLYQSVSLVVERGLREADNSGIRANRSLCNSDDISSGKSSIGYEVETKILAQLMMLLDEVLFMTNPTALVYIAVDGVSPMGKMSQQRNRRAASVKKGMHAKVKQLMGWDSNCITSGTLFMERVTQILHYYAVSRVEIANNNNNQPKFTNGNSCVSDFLSDITSSSSVPKEATSQTSGASCERQKIGMFSANISDNIVKVSEEFSAMAETFYRKTSSMNNYNATAEGSQQPTVFSVSGGTGGVCGMSNNNNGAVLSPGVTIVVNDVCIAGEGEHKIIDAIRSFRTLWRKCPCNKDKDGSEIGNGNSCSSADCKLFFVYPPASNITLGNSQRSGEETSEVGLIYSPNTTHCVVSPDTDVVVCSLALHEPHIDVLWYSGQDPEDSQFFSILLFRQILKGRLGFVGSENGSYYPLSRQTRTVSVESSEPSSLSLGKTSEILQYFKPENTMGFPFDKIGKGAECCHEDPNNEDRRIFFEETLHDLIFILLLFGNDFLPKLNVHTDISDGQLDKLLDFLVTDFVSRGKHIIDARTGQIDLSAAKYVISHCAKYSKELSVVSSSGGAFDPFGSGNDVTPMDDQTNHNSLINRVALSVSGSLNQQRHNNNNSGNKVQIEESPNKTPLTEDEQAEMCYDYWDGLQWTMLYCTGACPSWSWHYKHTRVPPVEQLIKYCAIRDNILNPVAAPIPPAHTTEGTRVSPLLTGTPQKLNKQNSVINLCVDCIDQPMDVFTQLILLMPPESRHQLPTSVIDAYTNDLSASIAGIEFEKLDLQAITKWCYIQRKRLSATDSRRMASFEHGKYPLMVRWPYETERAFFPPVSMCSTSVESKLAFSDLHRQRGPLGLFSENQYKVTAQSAVDLDDLFGDTDTDEDGCVTDIDNTSSCAQVLPEVSLVPQVHTTHPVESSSWVPIAGPFSVVQNKSSVRTSHCGVTNPAAFVSFFFFFNENLHVNGMSSVTSTYRCGDTFAEKQCAPAIYLKADWIKRRPTIQIGECRTVRHHICDNTQHGNKREVTFTKNSTTRHPSFVDPHDARQRNYIIPPDQPFLLPGVKEIPRRIRGSITLLSNMYKKMQKEKQNEKYGVKRKRSSDKDEPNTKDTVSEVSDELQQLARMKIELAAKKKMLRGD